MALNSQYKVNAKPQTAQVVVANKQSTQLRKMLWMFLSVIALSFVLNNISFAADTETENLYAKHYKEQNPYQLKSLSPNPDTKMYVSNHKEEDNVSMLEKGYDMMGSTGFTASDVAPELALAHGKAIQADMVLVYTKYSSAKVQQSRVAFLKEEAKKNGKIIDEKALDEEPIYDYFASYWAKIPMPTFGVHIVKLTTVTQDPETDEVKKRAEKGLKTLAVINDSAAAKAGILKGDDLLKVGEVELNQSEDLFTAVKRYKGQTIPVVVKRGNAEETLQVTLMQP
jgi:hypothetical protein